MSITLLDTTTFLCFSLLKKILKYSLTELSINHCFQSSHPVLSWMHTNQVFVLRSLLKLCWQLSILSLTWFQHLWLAPVFQLPLLKPFSWLIKPHTATIQSFRIFFQSPLIILFFFISECKDAQWLRSWSTSLVYLLNLSLSYYSSKFHLTVDDFPKLHL